MTRVESLKSYRREGETLLQARERLRAVVAKADDVAFADWLRKTKDGNTILSKAIAVFGDRSSAREWMGKPALGLGGYSAREMVASDEGRQHVIDLLGRLETGGWS